MRDRNLLRGFFLVAIALAFGLPALNYPIGQFGHAGPGLFPLLVASMLGLVGIATLVRARFAQPSSMDFNMRNIAIILGSLCGFALLSHFIGMVVGIVFLVFFSTLAGSSYSARRNAKVAAGLVAIAFLFHHFLGVQLPLY